MKSVTAEKVTTLEEQREGEVVAEEEVVKVTGEGEGDVILTSSLAYRSDSVCTRICSEFLYRSNAIFSQSVSSVNSRLQALVLGFCVG